MVTALLHGEEARGVGRLEASVSSSCLGSSGGKMRDPWGQGEVMQRGSCGDVVRLAW